MTIVKRFQNIAGVEWCAWQNYPVDLSPVSGFACPFSLWSGVRRRLRQEVGQQFQSILRRITEKTAGNDVGDLRLSSSAFVDEHLIHYLLLVVKTGPFDTFESLGKTDEPILGGHGKNAEGTCNPKPFALRAMRTPVTIIHQDQVRVEFDSKGDSVFLASVECFH